MSGGLAPDIADDRDHAPRVENLGRTFALPGGGTTEALRGIDVTTHRREFLCVVGPSAAASPPWCASPPGWSRPPPASCSPPIPAASPS